MTEEMGNISWEMETQRMNQKKILEIKNSLTVMEGDLWWANIGNISELEDRWTETSYTGTQSEKIMKNNPCTVEQF